jgi:deoxyadenosine/deoxycytidine kinase
MTSLSDRYRYLAVEGPIGVGKTSLAQKLAELAGSTPLLEDPDANPFLPGFYQDRERYALPTQLFFLFQRINQVRSLSQADLFRHATIADFIIDKDPLFARLTLNDDELRLYDQIFAHLKPQAASPDLVIYLQAPVPGDFDLLLRRIDEMRGAREFFNLGA